MGFFFKEHAFFLSCLSHTHIYIYGFKTYCCFQPVTMFLGRKQYFCPLPFTFAEIPTVGISVLHVISMIRISSNSSLYRCNELPLCKNKQSQQPDGEPKSGCWFKTALCSHRRNYHRGNFCKPYRSRIGVIIHNVITNWSVALFEDPVCPFCNWDPPSCMWRIYIPGFPPWEFWVLCRNTVKLLTASGV